jgi:hypothetical protein
MNDSIKLALTATTTLCLALCLAAADARTQENQIVSFKIEAANAPAEFTASRLRRYTSFTFSSGKFRTGLPVAA